MSFDSDIVVGFHLRLLFEMRLVVCGSLPEAGVRWSALAHIGSAGALPTRFGSRDVAVRVEGRREGPGHGGSDQGRS